MDELIRQVSRLTGIDGPTMRNLQREVLAIDEEWTNVYSDYHTGGWLTLSLLNSTRKATDTIIEHCEPFETDLLLKMPETRALLNELGFKYMWVRLAKIEPGTFFWEHRDYQELENADRFRIHIPVITNESAYLIINGARIHLPVGHLWKLNPVHRHGACNFGAEPRVHVLVDCYRDAVLDAHLADEFLDRHWLRTLPSPSAPALDRALAAAEAMARAGREEAAELSLLKLFHTYELEEGGSYDLVSRMYRALGEHGKSVLWQRKKAKFLYGAEDEFDTPAEENSATAALIA